MKRLFDFSVSPLGLILFSLIILVVSLAIRLESPGPMFHRGERMGRGGKRFRIFKFRTMVVDAADAAD